MSENITSPSNTYETCTNCGSACHVGNTMSENLEENCDKCRCQRCKDAEEAAGD